MNFFIIASCSDSITSSHEISHFIWAIGSQEIVNKWNLTFLTHGVWLHLIEWSSWPNNIPSSWISRWLSSTSSLFNSCCSGSSILIVCLLSIFFLSCCRSSNSCSFSGLLLLHNCIRVVNSVFKSFSWIFWSLRPVREIRSGYPLVMVHVVLNLVLSCVSNTSF